MGVRDLWHRTLVYFGLAEDESYYDDDEEVTAAQADIDRTYRERPSVRRIERPRRSSRSADIDEIYADEPPAAARRSRRPERAAPSYDDDGATTAVLRRDHAPRERDHAPRERERDHAPREEVTTAVKVHLIAPRSFNDAQQIADRFKNSIPVIINLQTAEPELSKRLIDFGSGLTYALDGGMQRIAEKVFLLTPKNVEVSAEDRARLVENGFFNPS
jgi:cell division inhibitor SepF